jgi:hypothetical protein
VRDAEADDVQQALLDRKIARCYIANIVATRSNKYHLEFRAQTDPINQINTVNAFSAAF